MNDRELLELAAKAAGYNDPIFVKQIGKIWNPLRDDGAALQLAVKLSIDLQFYDGGVDAFSDVGRAAKEMFGDTAYAATRRAIVRAAADLGSMK